MKGKSKKRTGTSLRILMDMGAKPGIRKDPGTGHYEIVFRASKRVFRPDLPEAFSAINKDVAEHILEKLESAMESIRTLSECEWKLE